MSPPVVLVVSYVLEVCQTSGVYIVQPCMLAIENLVIYAELACLLFILLY